MTNTTTEYAIVYKMNIAMELIKRGHKVFTTMPNPKRPQLTSWVFEKDEKFDEDFNELRNRG